MCSPTLPVRLTLSPRMQYRATEGTRMLVIGAGINPVVGAVNQDLHPGPGIGATWTLTERWPVDDGIFDKVVGLQVLEHIPVESSLFVCQEAHRVLVPGGALILEVPDFPKCCARFLGEDEAGMLRAIYSTDRHVGDAHRWGWDARQLGLLVTLAGFHCFHTEPGTDYHSVQIPTVRIEAARI